MVDYMLQIPLFGDIMILDIEFIILERKNDMFKTLKKTLSVFLALAMVLTSFSFSALAETVILSGNILDGSGDFTMPWQKVSSTDFSKPADVKDKNGDVVYALTPNGETATGYPQIFANTAAGATKNFLEFQFMLPEGSKGINLINQVMYGWKGATSTAGNGTVSVYVKDDGVSVGSALIPNTQFENDKWYTLGLDFPGINEDSTFTGNNQLGIYINGTYISSTDFKISTGLTWYVNRTQVQPVDITKSETPYIYMDNIRFAAGSYSATLDAPANLSIKDSSVISFLGDNTLTYVKSSTVAQLTNAITKSDDDVIRFYDASGNLLAQNDVVNEGDTMLAVSKNNTGMERTYSYYTVGEFVYQYGTDMYDGSKALEKGGSGDLIYTADIPGFAGKEATDDVYKLNDVYGDPYLSLGNFAYSTSGRDTCEFSFMLPRSSKGFDIEFGFVTTGNSYDKQPLLITLNGIFAGSSEEDAKLADIEPLKWYNMAIVSPGATAFDNDGNPTEYNRNIIIYLNGIKLERELTHEAATAYRHFRLNGIQSTDVYLDNLRRIAETYVPAYDILQAATSDEYRLEDGAFMLQSNPTVEEFLSNIVATKSNLRVIDANGATMADEDIIDDDTCQLVVAAKNGTSIERSFNYYPIVHDKYSAEITVIRDGYPAGTAYDDKCNLAFSADFTNFDGSTYKPVLYVALYRGNELETLWTDDATLITAGQSESLTVDFEMPQVRQGTSIKAMLVDADTLMPYTVAKALRYSYADTDATLYIIGDSVAQDYAINAQGGTDTGKAPFIQGWGYHIDSYLNDSITVDNRARSGWDTDRFLYPTGVCTKEDSEWYNQELRTTEADGSRLKSVNQDEQYKCWPTVKELIKPGDFVMIALGINDSGSANVPADRFEENLTVMCRDAQAAGATVIFSTPTISGGKWAGEWSFSETYKDYGDIAANVAAENNAYCLPTGATLATLYNSILSEYKVENSECTDLEAKQYVRGQFHRYDAIFNKPVAEGGYGYTGITGMDDNIHFADRGANRLAGIIATLISQTDCTLADYLINLPIEL